MLISPDRVFIGQTIRLRPFQENDRQTYQAMLSDRKTMEFLLYMTRSEQGGWDDSSFDERLQDRQNRNQNRIGFDLSIVNQKNEFLGCIGVNHIDWTHLWCEIGMILHHPYWGKGIAREARSLLLEYCFEELQLHRVEAKTFVENIRSRKNLESFGFRHEGTEREKFLVEGQRLNNTVYGLLREEWKRS